MMTSTPMMVPIIPLFMGGPPFVPFGGYPRVEEVNTPTVGQPGRL
jgi:hypothetical protein